MDYRELPIETEYNVGITRGVCSSANRLFSKKPITILFHDSLTELCLLPE